MKPIIFPLKPQMISPEVGALHQALAMFGLEITDAEKNEQRYGRSTGQAMRKLQSDHRLPATGVVNESTANLLNRLLVERAAADGAQTGNGDAHGSPEDKQPETATAAVVRGRLTRADGRPMPDLTIRAFDKEVRSEKMLGEVVTNEAGAYVIRYDPHQLSRPSKIRADLVVRAFNGNGEEVATSATTINAPAEQIVDLVFGNEPYRGPSEYARVSEAVRHYLGQAHPSELRPDEIDYLAAKTNFDSVLIAHLAKAEQFAQQLSVPAAVFYGLFRQGQPADQAALLRLKRRRLHRILQRAIDQNVIPDAELNLDAVSARFEQAIVEQALAPSTVAGKYSLGDLLETTALSRQQQETLLARAVRHENSKTDFWDEVRADPILGEALIDDVLFTIQVGKITGAHLSLVQYLQQKRKIGDLAGIRDLARLSATDWQQMLTAKQNGHVIGAPSSIPGQTESERIQNYAVALAGALEKLYPTTAVAGSLADAGDPAQAELIHFLDHNPDFELGAANIDQFLPSSTLDGISDVKQLSAGLKALQRVYRLAPADHRTAGVNTLLAAGLGSAHSIKRLGRDRFVKTFAESVGGVEAAAQIYNNASQTTAAALAMFTKYSPDQSAPWVLGDIILNNSSANIPNWETLFGSLDYCACEDCRSVYSPAAYFVDLLAFLDQYEAGNPILSIVVSQPTALDKLLVRRPDLAEIELSCENTNTLLPYVDLAIEVFENAVADTSNAYQTSWTEAELVANAEHLNPVAYDADHLAGQVYPFEMPFNLWLAEARIFLEHLGVSLHDILDTFLREPGADSSAAEEAWLKTMQSAGEYLGLSPLARKVISGDSRKSVEKLWGDPDGDLVAYLREVPNFLKQANLSYDQLLELLSARYVNPFQGTIIINPPDIDPFDPTPGPSFPDIPQPPEPPSPGIPINVGLSVTFSALCTLEGATIKNLNETYLDRIHRFLRLQQTLGWTMRDLDRIITALGDDDIDEVFLVRLANVKQLLDKFDLPLSELLSWWSTIETTAYEQDEDPRSLYERLFLNNAVINPVDEAFILNEDKSELAAIGAISDHISTIVAALEITTEELELIVAAKITDNVLNLANLSHLYRHVSMARALALGIPDFLSIKALTGIDPFDRKQISQTLKFNQRVEEIQAADFSIAELDYLLRHNYDPESDIDLSAETIRAALETLRAGLIRIAQDHVLASDPTGSLTASKLALLLPEEILTEAMAIIAGTSKQGLARQTAFIETYFGSFLDPAEAVAQLIDPANLSDVQERYAYVLDGATSYLAQTARRGLITQQIATDFDLELAVAQALLIEHMPEALASLEAVAETADPIIYQAAGQSYLRLQKIALALNKLGAGVADLPWLFGQDYSFDWYDLTNLPLNPLDAALDEATFRSWETLVRAFSFRDKFSADGLSLFAVLEAGYTSASVDQVWDKVSNYTGWARNDVETLAGASAFGFVFPDDYRDVNYLLRLDQAFALLDLIGMPAESVMSWHPTDNTALMQITAQSIKQAVKAKYDEANWLTIASPLKDAVREEQRAALVSYLIATMNTFDRPSDLFEHFLIDGEMDPCMETSRIKQAISSVQLFIQRCLMNLEPDVNLPPEAATQWEWMKQYRLWEAARKIFLYPENWIEPDLRDDMTPFFEELSSELLQSELTDASAETVFRHYLEKLDTIDQLEVRSLYHQMETTDSGEWIDTLHVIARTHNEPHVHYYRQRIDDAYWTPWERVNISISGSHEFLVVHEGSIYLFMPQLQQEDGDYWTATLQWSKYQNGQWTAPLKGEETLTFEAPRTENEEYIYFKIIPDGEDLLIVALWHEDGWTSQVSFTGDDYPAFRLRCNETLEIYDDPHTYTIEFPPDTVLDSMTLMESGSSDVPLVLLSADVGLGETVTPYEADEVPVLDQTPGRFQLTLPHQYDYFGVQDAFFYHGIKRAFYVQPKWSRFPYLETSVVSERAQLGAAVAPRADRSAAVPALGRMIEFDPDYDDTGQLPPLEKKLYFFSFHHPYVCDFSQRLNQGGVPALLQRATQSQSSEYFENLYIPNENLVQGPYPKDEVEFGYGSPYAIYNEELFFHAPLLIAERLRQNQRFAEAQRWYHYVFNPLAGTDGTGIGPERYWIYYPFYLETVGETTFDMMLDLAGGDSAVAKQVEQWRQDPFQPHALARLRPQAYQKNVVMKYIQNLVDWGDQLFALDTIESINEATQLYILAANILGAKPESLPAHDAAHKTFNDLRDNLDAFSNSLVELENLVGEPTNASAADNNQLPTLTLYFGIPHNENLLAMWDTVADRLFKIRHCMNIEGLVRQLPLFEPPIDPALLVRATAMGVDIDSVLTDLYAPLPHYRFQVMLQKALEFCGEVKSLGAALLSALEKKDAEALSLLRGSQENQLLQGIRQVKELQIKEADEAKQALERIREMVETRQAYYSDLINANWNEYETNQQDRLNDAHIAQLISQGLQFASSVSFGLAAGVKTGTLQPGEALELAALATQAAAGASDFFATHFAYRANLNSILGSHERRKEEWHLQQALATKELEQFAKQIAAAEIRLDLAERDLENLDTQISQAQAAYDLMQNKFTNEALSNWMISQISAVYFQSYQLAYDLAKRVEKAYQHELGVTDSSFIGFGYWDSLKKGLLAGENLAYNLRRMEMAYLDENKRELEITKHISLFQLDPDALLRLRETGVCDIHLPEVLFDMDFANHYFRRIKAVQITIPCVTGPYTNVSATLTLTQSWLRRQADINADPEVVATLLPQTAIATSRGDGDSGLFQLDFNDPRYLPFEGAGAVSSWHLELPAVVRPFDYDTINDVVIHLSYTARDGGTSFKQNVNDQLASALNNWKKLLNESRAPQARLISLRQEFSAEWNRLLSSAEAGTQQITLKLSKQHFPRYLDYLWEENGDGTLDLQPITLRITSVKVYLNPKSLMPLDAEDVQINGKTPEIASDIPGLLFFDSVPGMSSNEISNESGAELELTINSGGVRSADWKDMYVLLGYEIDA